MNLNKIVENKNPKKLMEQKVIKTRFIAVENSHHPKSIFFTFFSVMENNELV